MPVETAEIQSCLDRDGYFASHTSIPESPVQFVLAIGRSLGALYVPSGCDPNEPVIKTEPTRTRDAAPFNRPEAIGWHGDFATYINRPEVSIVYITTPDPRGQRYGGWRLASVARVLELLRSTSHGLSSLELLQSKSLPFSYSDGESPQWFKVVENQPNGKLGLRFYLPSLRRGCLAEFGEIPTQVASALCEVERAADQVAEFVPTERGSMLIANNWFALHDRGRQTVSRRHPNREALLCFIQRSFII